MNQNGSVRLSAQDGRSNRGRWGSVGCRLYEEQVHAGEVSPISDRHQDLHLENGHVLQVGTTHRAGHPRCIAVTATTCSNCDAKAMLANDRWRSLYHCSIPITRHHLPACTNSFLYHPCFSRLLRFKCHSAEQEPGLGIESGNTNHPPRVRQCLLQSLQ